MYSLNLHKVVFLLVIFLNLAFAPVVLALQDETEAPVQDLTQDVVEDVAFRDNLGRDTPRSSFVGFLKATEKFDFVTA